MAEFHVNGKEEYKAWMKQFYKDLDEAKAVAAKQAAEEAMKNRTSDIDYAKAQAELAEAVAQIQAIQKLRKTH